MHKMEHKSIFCCFKGMVLPFKGDSTDGSLQKEPGADSNVVEVIITEINRQDGFKQLMSLLFFFQEWILNMVRKGSQKVPSQIFHASYLSLLKVLANVLLILTRHSYFYFFNCQSMNTSKAQNFSIFSNLENFNLLEM